ncbi:MAG: DUF4446 family protein [Lachnospiraceae bacterium]|nr:DUF4446 family protein [Lachnospiraceae bacterium]
MPLLEQWGIDPSHFLLAFAAINVILLVVVIILIVQCRRLFKRYDTFMRGRDADTLEDLIAQLCDQVQVLQTQDQANKDLLKLVNRNLVNSYQKMGLVKYNAFEGMGGQTSFALAVLDMNNNGFIMNVIHSRSSCYNYIKEVKSGEVEVALSVEEKAALTNAMKNRNRVYQADKEEKN